jgi:hypothetical protein
MRINEFQHKVGSAFTDLNNGIVSDYGAELAFKVQETSFYCRRLSTAQIGVMIALGASCLEADEAYLNIGVWDGFSLLAATQGAPDAICIGVADFSEMNQQKQPLLNPNLTRDYGDTRENFYRAYEDLRSPKTSFYEKDWREVMQIAPFPVGRLGLVYYDAEHTKDAHAEFFEAVIPHLSAECLIMVDDTRIDFVRRSVDHFIVTQPNFSKLIDVGGERRRDPAWWGGFIVIGREVDAAQR